MSALTLTRILYVIVVVLVVYIVFSIRRTKTFSVSDAVASIAAIAALIAAVQVTGNTGSVTPTPTTLASNPTSAAPESNPTTIATSAPQSTMSPDTTAIAHEIATTAENAIFYDDFTQDTKKWFLREGTGSDFSEQLSISDKVGTWSLVPTKPISQTIFDRPASDINVGDLDVTAEMRLSEGEPDTGYGIMFRYNDTGSYYFIIRQDKFFLVRISFPDGKYNYLTKNLGDPDEKAFRKSEIINVGGWNNLRAVVKGSAVTLYINDQEVFEKVVENVDAGTVGMTAQISGSQVKQVLIRKFQVVKPQ